MARIGVLGWTWRVLVGATVLAAGILSAAVAIRWSAYQQLHRTQEQQRAAAFARLSGPARRLAIYDAFADQIDRRYFDQTFAGIDWPTARREWRERAAAAPDDSRLYFDVL